MLRAGIRIVDASVITQAVILVDTSVLTQPADDIAGRSSQRTSFAQRLPADPNIAGGRGESPLPDYVPNTIPDEPSNPPEMMASEPDPDVEPAAPVRKLVRRRVPTPSSAPAREPLPPPAAEETPAPRKVGPGHIHE
jgi:hypothetical protein